MENQNYPIPTGYLLKREYTKGQLETLSIGDYGKEQNVKADFLGYSREIDGVPSGYCKPLSEKWVITISTQYGCPMKCNFCDVPNIKFKGNVSMEDMFKQIKNAVKMFPDVRYTERLNLHFARMGEPIFNSDVFNTAEWIWNNKKRFQDQLNLRIETFHPVLTTSLPKRFKDLEKNIDDWCWLKNELYNGQAGLQFSINSTDESQRTEMFSGMQLSLEDFAKIAERMPDPISRKYCLNFAYSTDFIIDAEVIKKLFDPEKFMCKITPIHNNNSCTENGIETIGGYESWEPYNKPENDLIEAGFDVLVFVPSMDEENALVTCGNTILGGGNLKCGNDVIKINGLKNN
jgi:23S rRNA (adenine2503-C2)-methyltransferase